MCVCVDWSAACRVRAGSLRLGPCSGSLLWEGAGSWAVGARLRLADAGADWTRRPARSSLTDSLSLEPEPREPELPEPGARPSRFSFPNASPSARRSRGLSPSGTK